MSQMETTTTSRWAINFLALLGLVVALWFGKPLLLPLVVALMLATMLWPLVNYFHRHWRLPRVLAGTLVITVLVLLSVLALLWGVVAVQGTVQELLTPWGQRDYYNRMRDRIARELSLDLAEELMPREKMEESIIFKSLNQFIEHYSRRAPEFVLLTAEQVLLILFLVLFLAVEGDMLIRRTSEIFGPSAGPDSLAARRALRAMAQQVRSYLIWRTLVNAVMAVFLGFLYWKVLGLKQPWTWAILAGVLTYIPYLGPILAFIPAGLDAFINQDLFTVVILAFIYVLILTIEGYVIFPLVIGRNMELNATTVMVSCLFWWLVWGEIGLFLALPMMGGIKAICSHVPSWVPWANLMGMEHAPGGAAAHLADDAAADGQARSKAGMTEPAQSP